MAEGGEAGCAVEEERGVPGLGATGRAEERPAPERDAKQSDLGAGDAGSGAGETERPLGGGDNPSSMEGTVGGGDQPSSMEQSKEPPPRAEEMTNCVDETVSSVEEPKQWPLGGGHSTSSTEGGDTVVSMEESNEGPLGGGDSAPSMEGLADAGGLEGRAPTSLTEVPEQETIDGNTPEVSTGEAAGEGLQERPPVCSTGEPAGEGLQERPPVSSTGEPAGEGLQERPPEVSTGEPAGEGLQERPPVCSTGEPAGEGLQERPPVCSTGELVGEGLQERPPVCSTGEPAGEGLQESPPVCFTGEPAGEGLQERPPVCSTGEPAGEGRVGGSRSIANNVPVEEKVEGAAPECSTEEHVEEMLVGGAHEGSTEVPVSEGLGGAAGSSAHEPMEEKLEGAPEGSTEVPAREELEVGASAIPMELGALGVPGRPAQLQGDNAQASTGFAVHAIKEQDLTPIVPVTVAMNEDLEGGGPPGLVQATEGVQPAPVNPVKTEEKSQPEPASPMKVMVTEAWSVPASPREVVACEKAQSSSPVKVAADGKLQPAIESTLTEEAVCAQPPPGSPMMTTGLAPASPLKLVEEEKAQLNLASHVETATDETSQTALVCPMMAVDQTLAVPSSLVVVSDKAHSAQGPMNVVAYEKAQPALASPSKLAAENIHPFLSSPGKSVEIEETGHSELASPLKLDVDKEAFPAPRDPLKPAEVKAEQAPSSPIHLKAEEEAEMAPTSPLKLACEPEQAPASPITLVAEEEAEMAEEEAEMAPASPIQLAAGTVKAPASPIKVAAEEAVHVPASPITLMAKEEASIINANPDKMPLDEAMHGPAGTVLLESEKVVESHTSALTLVADEEAIQVPVIPLKLENLPVSTPPVNVAEEHGQVSSTKPVKTEALSATSFIKLADEVDGVQATTVLAPVMDGLKPLSPKKGAADWAPHALTSPKKPVTQEVLEVQASLLNGAAEEETQQVLTSPRKQKVSGFTEDADSPRKMKVEDGTQILANPQKLVEDYPEAPIFSKKRPAEEESEALAKPKKQAVHEVTDTLASSYQAVEHQTHIFNNSQEMAEECEVNLKKRAADEDPDTLVSHKKRAVEEGTEDLVNLKKRGAEEELETSTNPKRRAAEQEAEVKAVNEVSDPRASPLAQAPEVVLEAPTSPQNYGTEISPLVESIPENQLAESGLKAATVPEKQGAVEDLEPLNRLNEQVMEEASFVQSVPETSLTEEALKAQSVPEAATEDLQALDSLTENRPMGLSIPEGPTEQSSSVTMIALNSLEEPQKSVVIGAEASVMLPVAVPVEDQMEDGDEGAQEYPGSPMDLVEDEDSLNTCENLVVGEILQTQTSALLPAGTSQGTETASDRTSEQGPSLATEGFNGSTYLGHNASLYPVTAADGTSLPFPSEYEKHWKAAHNSPSDFTTWTDLLQYVEQENHLVAARKAFTAFFGRYPYCYGYWKKYADMEQRFSFLKEAEEVYEQGLQAIPLSVDLWMHYITFLQETQDMNEQESLQKLCNVFEMALAAAGMDFRSDKLWEMYINWEKERGDLQAITVIYDRVLSTPTQLYSHHFEKFREHVTNNSPVDILSREEFMWLRSKLIPEAAPVAATMGTGDQTLGQEGCEEAAQVAEIEKQSEVDQQKMRELIISLREQMYKQTEAEVSKRWAFEDGIKRPYFHVKPLERAQLKNWREYLDFEIANGSHTRTIVLFERCVIACALYEDFWLKYTKYLENHTVIGTRSVFQRSCLYHLPRKPNLHLLWAAFEERQGDIEEARNILKTLDETVPGLAMVRLRRVSLERRTGNLEAAETLLREAIRDSEGTSLATFYSIKLARQVLKVQNNLTKARQVLKEALEKDPDNAKLYLNLLELEFSADLTQNEGNTMECIEKVLRSNIPTDAKIVFSQRRVEFLEDFGSSLKSLLTAYDDHQKLLKLQSPKRKATENGSAEEPEEKKAKADEVLVPAPPIVTTASSTTLMGDTSTSQVAAAAAYNYNAWYQNYGNYGYQNTWNYNYYPQS